MSNSQPSSVKFWAYASLALLVSAAAIASLWPLGLRTAHSEATQLIEEGDQTSGGEAESDFKLATWLDSSNRPAYEKLGATQIALGQPNAALTSLARAGEGSAVTSLKVRTLIELGRYNDAASTATSLMGPNTTDNTIVLTALAYSLAGRSTPGIKPLSSRVSSPGAAQAVLNAEAGKLPLASELYATGLLQSSSVLLAKLPTSYERNLLLGHIYFTRHSRTDLAQAQDLIKAAVALSPASIEARQLLAHIYRDQNESLQAQQQNSLVAKLQSGRP